MIKTRLDQYRGRLTSQQIAEGMNVARQNAIRLRRDAEMLLEAGRYPTAASLAVLAVEEAGKVTILRGMAMHRNDSALEGLWRDYRSHRAKNGQWIAPALISKGARRLEDFRQVVNRRAAHVDTVEALKQVGFYTDCLEKGQWSEPEKVIGKELAETMVQIAKLLTSEDAPAHTVKEVELWTQHMGRIFDKTPDEMKAALHDWYEAMVEHGLMTVDMDHLDAFLGGVYSRRE